VVVEVVGPEGMAGHLVEPRDRGSDVVTAVDEFFDPKKYPSPPPHGSRHE
jgi:hypothetical protein